MKLFDSRIPSYINIIAVIYMAAGIFILYYTYQEFMGIYSGNLDHSFINSLVVYFTDHPLYEKNGEEYKIGKASAIIISIFILSMFAIIVTSVALNLIRVGVNLVSPTYFYDEDRKTIKRDI